MSWRRSISSLNRRMDGSIKQPTQAIVKFAIADVEAGEAVFATAGAGGRYDVCRDVHGRDFLGVCTRSEIDHSPDLVRKSRTRSVVDHVKLQHGIVAQTCWIAHVKELNGLPPRGTRTSERVKPCPPQWRGAIEEATRHYGWLR